MLDGTLEPRVSASGYLQGGYWDPGSDSYGTRIQLQSSTSLPSPFDYAPLTCFFFWLLVGTLHDHLINFKVDFDIVNEKNSLLEKTTHVREIAHPWLDEDWGLTTTQQYIKSRYIDTEDESRLFYPPNFQGSFAVVNKDETNSWGAPKGYAIHPGYSPIYNVRLPFLSLSVVLRSTRGGQ